MRVSVIGAGSWGTTLAAHLCRLGHETLLWVWENDLRLEMQAMLENRTYLPGFRLPEQIAFTSDLGHAAQHAEAMIMAVPSHVMRDIALRLKPGMLEGARIISATKGIENETQLRMTQVLQEVLDLADSAVLALSGPSFALEVMRGEPTAIALACSDPETGKLFQGAFSGGNVRLYVNTDMIGTELGGAVKNVIAIAAGVLNGLGLGANATAALITRGIAEIRRLTIAAGGRPETLAGLAGLGDLVLTCTGQLSRNRQVGVELGKGRGLSEILGGMNTVAEGVKTAHSTRQLGQRLGVEMPIVEQTHAILYQDVSARDAVQRLMERELKQEEWR
jgi:glycerol-3-phosphate dehydrogenase (NAD(P)+)